MNDCTEKEIASPLPLYTLKCLRVCSGKSSFGKSFFPESSFGKAIFGKAIFGNSFFTDSFSVIIFTGREREEGIPLAIASGKLDGAPLGHAVSKPRSVAPQRLESVGTQQAQTARAAQQRQKGKHKWK